MTIYINIQEDPRFAGERNFYWRSGYIDQSHYTFREVREFLQKYHLSKQLDEVIFVTVDDADLDGVTLAKLEFYIDKLAKSAAAKARGQSVAIVSGGTVGIKSLLPKLAKSYTGAKGVQIVTIGVSPYALTDAGRHNPPITADGENILTAGQGYDYHILTGAPIRDGEMVEGSWGSESKATYEIVTGMISNVGHVTFIYGNGSVAAMRELFFVPKACAESVKFTAILLQGCNRIGDALCRFFAGQNPSDIKIADGITLSDIGERLQNSGMELDHLRQRARLFLIHSLDSSLPDILPTGVTLDKTGKPAWQTAIETKNFY